MKSFSFMLALLATSAVAFAQEVPVVKLGEVKLTDGRTYKDVVFVSESPMRITVRHSGGLAQLEKKKLPATLLAQYPADEAAAERQRIEDEQRKAAAAAEYERTRPQREAAAERLRKERAASAAFNEAAAAREQADQASAMANARRLAQSEADDYFRTTWRPGNTAVIVTDYRTKLESIETKPGWPGHQPFSGEGYVDYYMSKGSSFSSNRVRFSGEIAAQGRVSITPK